MQPPVCICAGTCDRGEGGGGMLGWREREILVQLNLINSEMEIISAWSTGETRDGTRESNREGKVLEQTKKRESGGTSGKVDIFLFFSYQECQPSQFSKISDIRAYFCLLHV